MPNPNVCLARRGLLASALAAWMPVARGQAAAYPSRPILVIVPFAAGGSVDAAARLLMPRLAERLRQPVVIENVPGAAGTIGTLRATRSAPDGHVLLFAVASPINVAPLVSPSLVKYDALRDLAPVATVGTSPFVLVANPKVAAATTAELIELARRQPGRLGYGTDGVGTSMHVTAELIQQRAGMQLMHVPYRSGPQVLIELSGGVLDLAVMPVTLAQPFIKDRKVRALGVTSRQRWPSLPDTPALAETPVLQGLDVESWYGLFAPARTDAGIVERLARELAAVAAEPDTARRLEEYGLKAASSGPAAFAAMLARERAALSAVVSAAGIKAE